MVKFLTVEFTASLRLHDFAISVAVLQKEAPQLHVEYEKIIKILRLLKSPSITRPHLYIS